LPLVGIDGRGLLAVVPAVRVDLIAANVKVLYAEEPKWQQTHKRQSSTADRQHALYHRSNSNQARGDALLRSGKAAAWRLGRTRTTGEERGELPKEALDHLVGQRVGWVQPNDVFCVCYPGRGTRDGECGRAPPEPGRIFFTGNVMTVCV